MKHGPDPEEPGRCRATDLLIADCSGCRGSDESFVDALLKTEPEPAADYEKTDPYPDPAPAFFDEPSYGRPKARKWWLDTGPTSELVPDSHPFKSSYRGSLCKSCRQEIMTGQLIQHVNVGGYAHVACLKALAK